MRLFIALSLPADAIAELGAMQQRLKRSASHQVKWVAPDSIHLTLQFLGEVEEERTPALLDTLDSVRSAIKDWTVSETDQALSAHRPAAAPTLHLTPVGAFPNLRRPQTIWAGVGGDLLRLTQLHKAVLAATEPLGFAPEVRPFRAHLTLGRTRREATPQQLAVLGAAIVALPPPRSITWSIGLPILFQSVLTPAGAVYRALQDERL